MKLGFALPVVLLAFTAASTGSASTVRVPQDVPTIQAALDGDADTVQVSPGFYPERLVFTKSVVLRGKPGMSGVRVLGASVEGMDYPNNIVVSASHVRWIERVVVIGGMVQVSFELCWFEAGMLSQSYYGPYVSLSGCTLRGDLTGSFYTLEVVNCTFLRAGISGDGEGVEIVDNTFQGPSKQGIKFRIGGDDSWVIRGNRIQNVEVGISMDAGGGTVEYNQLTGCSATGIQLGTREPVIRHNVVRLCGGTGIQAGALRSRCDSNRVEFCGGDGIAVQGTLRGNDVRHVRGHGIRSGYVLEHLEGNTVLHTGGDGVFSADAIWWATDNVIGFCRGNGINAKVAIFMERNTIFDNRQSGVLMRESPPAVIRANIAAFNGKYGVEYQGTGTYDWQIGCNDWYRNDTGSIHGLPVSETDLSVNPRFCGRLRGDVRLHASSPLASSACGPIGAGEVGCHGARSAEDLLDDEPVADADPMQRRASGPRVVVESVTSNGVEMSLSLAEETPLSYSVYDVQGRLVHRQAGSFGAGSHSLALPADVRLRLSVGVYFARVEWPGGSHRTRIVIRH